MTGSLDFYTAEYFLKSRKILEGRGITATWQVFQKQHGAVLCGIDHVVRYIRANAGDVEIRALSDGDIIDSWEPVMTITGAAERIVSLESTYLGMLARQTRVATNARKVVEAANGKPVLFFADRFDVYQTQEWDGYAAGVGGVSAVCTRAMANQSGLQSVGTMPHALIAAFGGDTVAACQAFVESFPDTPLTALVDFHNDCVKTSLEVLDALGEKLYAVRLDTSEKLVDKSLENFENIHPRPVGVNTYLVWKVREALDANGGKHVKIVVSGGFTAEKIANFEQLETPVDVYAVGSSLLKGATDFTSDIVEVNGQPCSKVGRSLGDTSRLALR